MFKTLSLALIFGLAVTGLAAQRGKKPTVAEAQAFVAAAEKRLLDLANKSSRASWVQSNFITDDTEQIAADANKDLLAATTDLATEATRFDGLDLPADLRRKLLLLKLSLTLTAPRNPAAQEELTRIAVSLESDYGKGKYCPEGEKGRCLSLNDMERTLASSRDPQEMLKIWRGWHAIAPPMRARDRKSVV